MLASPTFIRSFPVIIRFPALDFQIPCLNLKPIKNTLHTFIDLYIKLMHFLTVQSYQPNKITPNFLDLKVFYQYPHPDEDIITLLSHILCPLIQLLPLSISFWLYQLQHCTSYQKFSFPTHHLRISFHSFQYTILQSLLTLQSILKKGLCHVLVIVIYNAKQIATEPKERDSKNMQMQTIQESLQIKSLQLTRVEKSC